MYSAYDASSLDTLLLHESMYQQSLVLHSKVQPFHRRGQHYRVPKELEVLTQWIEGCIQG